MSPSPSPSPPPISVDGKEDTSNGGPPGPAASGIVAELLAAGKEIGDRQDVGGIKEDRAGVSSRVTSAAINMVSRDIEDDIDAVEDDEDPLNRPPGMGSSPPWRSVAGPMSLSSLDSSVGKKLMERNRSSTLEDASRMVAEVSPRKSRLDAPLLLPRARISGSPMSSSASSKASPSPSKPSLWERRQAKMERAKAAKAAKKAATAAEADSPSSSLSSSRLSPRGSSLAITPTKAATMATRPSSNNNRRSSPLSMPLSVQVYSVQDTLSVAAIARNYDLFLAQRPAEAEVDGAKVVCQAVASWIREPMDGSGISLEDSTDSIGLGFVLDMVQSAPDFDPAEASCRKQFLRIHLAQVSSSTVPRIINAATRAFESPSRRAFREEGKSDNNEEASEGGRRVKITADTAPHYLFFDSQVMPNGATVAKCNPPLRSPGNRAQLFDEFFSVSFVGARRTTFSEVLDMLVVRGPHRWRATF